MASPVANFLNVGRMQDEKRKLDRDAELARQAQVREDAEKQRIQLTKDANALRDRDIQIRADELRLHILNKQAELKSKDAEIRNTDMFMRKAASLKTSDPEFQRKLTLINADYPLAKPNPKILATWEEEFKREMSAKDAIRNDAEAEKIAQNARLPVTKVSTSATGNKIEWSQPKADPVAAQKQKSDAREAITEQNKVEAYQIAQSQAAALWKQMQVKATDAQRTKYAELSGKADALAQSVKDPQIRVRHALVKTHNTLEDELKTLKPGTPEFHEKATALNDVKKQLPTYQLLNPNTGAAIPGTETPGVPQRTKPPPVESAADQSPPPPPPAERTPAKPAPVTQSEQYDDQKGPTLQPLSEEDYQGALAAIKQGAPMEAIKQHIINNGYDPSRISPTQSESQ